MTAYSEAMGCGRARLARQGAQPRDRRVGVGARAHLGLPRNVAIRATKDCTSRSPPASAIVMPKALRMNRLNYF